MRIFQPTVTGSNTTTGSLHISGPVYFYTLDDTVVSYVLTYDTESGQVYYTASSQVGTPTPPAPSDTYVQYNSGSKFGADQYFRYIYTSRSLEQGNLNQAIGQSSHAEGNQNYAIGQYSHTEGANTYTGTLLGFSASIASGIVTLYEGYGDKTLEFNAGDYLWFTDDDFPEVVLIDSVTYSNPNTIITLNDLSFNKSSCVVGNANLHPDQWLGDQKMGASHAHAEGEATYTLGAGAHAEGLEATAIGNWSHAAGQRTLALGSTQFVIGQYNKPSISQSAFIIGDGTADNNRHNVLFVSKSHFEISASNTYLQGLPEISSNYIITYDTASGQVYYALSTDLETSPFPFTGSAGITGSIILTGSMLVNGAISASLGENTVGFYGTASWAVSASQALTASYLLNPYPIDVTGSSLYSVDPVAGVPSDSNISNSIFFGNQAGLNSNNAHNSNFLGEFAGKSANGAYNSNFLGPQAGNSATDAHDSNFLGSQSGYQATDADNSNFLGFKAGYQATNAQYSNFLGLGAGNTAVNAENSNFLGYDAGFSANNASHSNFLGYRAGTSQDNAAYSTLIGYRAGNKGGVLGNLIGPNNIIIGTNITLDTNRQDSINIGGIIFGTGSYNDTNSVSFPYSSSTNGRIGINIVYPSYSFHASGSISFPSLTSVPQVNVVVVDTASGQLFYLPTGSVGGGGVTINNNNNNYLITATGTSNTLEGEANLQFDGSTLTVVGNILANSITGSFTGSLTGSLYGTASWAESASFALTAAAAPEDTWIQYNKEGLFSATGSFRFIYTSQSFQQGDQVVAFGFYSHAQGSGSLASGSYSHAEGAWTTASGDYSHAEGYKSIASGAYSHAEGYINEALGAYSHAEGGGSGLPGFPLEGNTASGPGSHAEGGRTAATNTGSHSEGYETIASGMSSHAEGYLTLASGQFSHAEGDDSTASGYGSHAEGRVTIASQIGAHSEGYYTLASGDSSHAEGSKTVASGIAAHAEGSGSVASGQFSHAEGKTTQAQGDISHTEGSSSIASGKGAHAEGFSTTAFGDYSHAEGFGSQTSYSSLASHAEGFFTYTNNLYSHAEGSGSYTSGFASHAEGFNTTSSGEGSHSEGESTIALGKCSHAEGSSSVAYGTASLAAGLYTIASGSYQLTIGQFNLHQNTSPSAFIIGNGTSNANRSNLLFASGSNVEISGSLYVTSSLITEGSRVRKYREITLTNSDIGDPPTYSIEEDDDIILIIDTTNTIPGATDGTLSVTNFLANSPAGRCVEIVTTEAGTAGTILYIAAGMGGTSNLMLNRVSMTNSVREVNNAVGESVTLMAMGLAKTGSIWGNGW